LQLRKDTYSRLTPVQRLQVARHPNRPTFLDIVLNISDKFVELHGDRAGLDDPAMVCGLASIDGVPFMCIGHQKGRNTKVVLLPLPPPPILVLLHRLCSMASRAPPSFRCDPSSPFPPPPHPPGAFFQRNHELIKYHSESCQDWYGMLTMMAPVQENIHRNFGMPQPNGYRKALRFMKHADHFGFPILTFVDTPGAYAGKAAEEQGQVRFWKWL